MRSQVVSVINGFSLSNAGTKNMPGKIISSTFQHLLLSVIVVLSSACANYPTNHEPPAYKIIKPGQILQLTQSLAIPPEKAAVFFQFGKVISPKLVDQWAPSCRLVVQNLSENERIIQPDEFAIIRIDYETYLASTKPIWLASRGFGAISDSGATPIAEVYATQFLLKSDKQPLVKRLICKHWEDPYNGNHLTIQQIRQTLGSIIEIKE